MKYVTFLLLIVIILLCGGVAMAHGKNDYGATAQKQTVYSLQDMAELAARLGSIDTFSRSGDVVWMDDFEENINKWSQVVPGTGASIALSTEAAKNGAKSAKIVTGSDNWWSAILRQFGPPVFSRMGAEISFADQDANTYLQMILKYYDGAKLFDASIKYYPDEKILQILDGTTPVYVTFATGVSLPSQIYAWSTMKLVVDLTTKKYVRLLLNDKTYDISAYNMQQTASVTVSLLEAQIYLYPEIASNLHIYFDDFILKQNEP